MNSLVVAMAVPMSLWDGIVSIFNAVMTPLYHAVSAILVLLSIGSLALRGLELGIEFKGGADFAALAKQHSNDGSAPNGARARASCGPYTGMNVGASTPGAARSNSARSLSGS